MAIFSKQLFENPYIDIGKDADICVLCRKEYMRQHPDVSDYKVDAALRKQLSGKRIFKLFQNSNTPFVLCRDHLEETLNEIRDEDWDED